MTDNNDKHIQAKKASEKEDEIEELKTFLKRKKIETEALKKIMKKLNTDENNTSDK